MKLRIPSRPLGTFGALCCSLVFASLGHATWTSQDVGTVGVAGTDSYNGGTGVYTIAGAGADINGTADGFHYVYQSLTADGELTARVATIQNTNASAKAGVMVRQSTAAGDINAFIAVTYSTGVTFQQRTALNGSTTTSLTSGLAAPYWVRIVKDGTLVSTFRSPDGVTWTYVGCIRLTSLTNPVNIGFAVTSHTTGATCTATFDNITLATPTTYSPVIPWSQQDIGTFTVPGAVHSEQNIWTAFGEGTGITGTADAFHFGYQPLTGNGTALVQVNSLSTTTALAHSHRRRR